MNAAELEETERRIAAIVREDLYERFPTGFIFDPIKVYPRTDHTGDEYLQIFIIYDSDGNDLNPGHTMGLMTRLKPKLRELNVNDYISDGFVEKSEWDNLTEVPLL